MSDAFDEDITPPCSGEYGVTIDAFVAYSPTTVYIFTPCRETWTKAGVNSRLPRVPVLTKAGKPRRDSSGKIITILATTWLDQNRAVEQMTWCPGYPLLIKDRLVVAGGWIDRPGVTTFNHYRPPRDFSGDPHQAGPWIDHVRKIYPDDADHLIRWLAHRVQRPSEKINHAIVLGGAQGIGKDTMLEPIKHAVGPWNFQDIIPSQLLGRFNSFAKAVVLRINEAHDQGDSERVNRFNLYERAKLYSANPPDVLRVDEKHLREYYVFNILGLIITTNHKTDGIFLPADDRRHYVAWSHFTKEEFAPVYWNTLWRWYYSGGFGHVAAYLAGFDIADFDPKAPPPQTAAFWEIVSSSSAPEDSDLADAIDKLGDPEVTDAFGNPSPPEALTLKQLVAVATGAFAEWLADRRSRRAIPHRLERCGYITIKNPGAEDGMWKFKDGRQQIYVRAELPLERRIAAARKIHRPREGQ